MTRRSVTPAQKAAKSKKVKARALTPDPIDLSFRPGSYFWPVGLEVQLLTHIKGAARRAAVQRLIDTGQTDQIPAFLAKTELSEEERKRLGRIHPMFMGGEYLPNQDTDEVEIARIEINSTTFDVTSVYARRGTSAIHYRVVDEYNGDTLTGPPKRTSAKPLTLGELTDQIALDIKKLVGQSVVIAGGKSQ